MLSFPMGKTRYRDGVCQEASTPINTSIKEQVCSFENLYKAMHICKRNVLWKDSTAGFVKNGLKNCHKLHEELMDGTYKISKYSVFIVHEKKTRIITSTRIRDRVVQRSLCDNYLYKELTRHFIYDNCACLVGKGTDFARNRLKCHLQRHFRKHGLNGYILKVDIHDYFGSTPHSVAKAAVAKRVRDEWARNMVFDIIDSFDHISKDAGMGLGSQITQLVQLAVLDDLDHEVKEKMMVKGYVRYMDDFILIHKDRKHLEKCLDVITIRLKSLGLSINEKKTGIQPITHGVKFLGFSFKLTPTGKVIMKLLAGKAGNERKRLRKMAGVLTEKHLGECYQSWRSFAEKGNNFRLLSDMDCYYRRLRNERY